MYIPNAYREDDVAQLVAFMQTHGFVSLVSTVDGLPVASHIPVVVTMDDDGVTITGHLAKANPQWKSFGIGEALAIFTGPHAYISPSLYEKRENVPTWNYIAVHAYGTPRPIQHADARAALEKLIAALIADHEPAYQQHWDSLPDKYRDGMLWGIVGFEMRVTRLEGKYKLSQNRSQTDQDNVAHVLLQNTDPTIAGVGGSMMANLESRK